MAKKAPTKFHERFNISVDMSTAQKRFLNRIKNLIWDNFLENEIDEATRQGRIAFQVSIQLGEEFDYYDSVEEYIGSDYHKCLHALEVTYEVLDNKELRAKLEGLILLALTLSEIDLGIHFERGHFIKTGAKLLDDELINKSLEWLRNKEYKSVYSPFEKGLSVLLESERKPQLLADVVTDVYESLEALAKIFTRRPNKDLSSNAELFIKSIKVSEYYRKILKEYIAYANSYRHGQEPDVAREVPTYAEVESFVYLTGVFIRLAISAA